MRTCQLGILFRMTLDEDKCLLAPNAVCEPRQKFGRNRTIAK
jgi:hypothetical protein